jgi:Skp family chaperone for outer membrane proteins
MKRRIVAALLPAALALASLAIAQTPAPQTAAPQAPVVIGNAKLAWFNLEQAIVSCEEGKQQFSEVQKFVERKNSELEALRKELDTLRNQLQVQGSKLTDEAQADLSEQIEAKDTQLQRFQQDTQKEIDSRRVKVHNYIGRKLLAVIDKLAKEKGVSAILILNPSRDAWIDPSLVITEEVVKMYNAAYPPAAAKPPAAVPAKKQP